MTCHYNSNGGGPLNDYGRSLAAIEISGRLFGGTDETLSAQSGFLGSVGMPWWWRPSIGYRGLNLQQNVSRNSQTRFIHMQSDVTNVLRFDEEDKFIAVFNFGYAPTPRNVSSDIPQANKNWISREHYIRYELSETIKLFAGFLDKNYGIHTPDHEAFARRYTYNAQNDQVHGIMLNFNSLPWEFSLHGFAGNLQQEAELRQKGASFIAEYELNERARVGFTGQYLKNNYMEMVASALLMRLGVGPGSAILLESGLINVKPSSQASKLGSYTFLQPYLKLARGVNFLTTVEYYTSEVTKNTSRLMRWGPGLQYFPFQRMELRAEAWNERSFEPDSIRADDWTVMSQVHVWL